MAMDNMPGFGAENHNLTGLTAIGGCDQSLRSDDMKCELLAEHNPALIPCSRIEGNRQSDWEYLLREKGF